MLIFLKLLIPLHKIRTEICYYAFKINYIFNLVAREIESFSRDVKYIFKNRLAWFIFDFLFEKRVTANDSINKLRQSLHCDTLN